MILWVDAQLSPRLCPWVRREFQVEAVHVRTLGLRESEDREIFDAARRAKVVVLTKDEDFVALVERFGKPPQVIWLTCGNVSNARIKKVLTASLADALAMIRKGEPVVEITTGEGRRIGRTRLTQRSKGRGSRRG